MNDKLTITSLAAGGDGAAEHNGRKIFVPFAAVGDVVDESGRIIAPSSTRQQPECAHFGECGGCKLQHISTSEYNDFKNRIARRAAEHSGFAEVEIKPTHFCQPASRRRAEFSLHHSTDGVRLAFKADSSHRNIAIDNCAVLCHELQDLIKPFATALSGIKGAGNFVSLHLTKTATGIDAVIETKAEPSRQNLAAIAEMAAGLGLARISYSHDVADITTIAEFIPVQIAIGSHMVALPPMAFLQASDEAQAVITAEVLSAMAGHKIVADLFCGLGTYAIPLAEAGAKVEAYENDAAMVAAMPASAKKLQIKAIKRDLFTYPLNHNDLPKFDAVVINPPRAGAKAQVAQLAKARNVKTIVMVSCNPFSFAADAKILKNGGFKMKSLLPVDQFVWSHHLELVAVFERIN